ncbi:hypothetical protein GCM10020001_022580 [Nonomuraea salmonea]
MVGRQRVLQGQGLQGGSYNAGWGYTRCNGSESAVDPASVCRWKYPDYANATAEPPGQPVDAVGPMPAVLMPPGRVSGANPGITPRPGTWAFAENGAS